MYYYNPPMLQFGQVFELSGKLLVCLRVNDCSARVVEASPRQVEDPNHVFDEFDRLGYRITACPDPQAVKKHKILPKERIKTYTALSLGKSRIVGYDEIPRPDGTVRARGKKILRTRTPDARATILEVLVISAGIANRFIAQRLSRACSC